MMGYGNEHLCRVAMECLDRGGGVGRGGTCLEDLCRVPGVGWIVEPDQCQEDAVRVVSPAFFQIPGFEFWPT